MHDLILEIDSILLWAVLAFAILAVVLFLLTEEDDRKPEPHAILYEKEHVIPDARPKEYKPIETPKRTTSIPVDDAVSEYRSAKLQSCAREIEMLERLNLIKGPRDEPIQKQYEIKGDRGDKKRGLWD